MIATLLDGILSLLDSPEMMNAGTCTGVCKVVEAKTSIVEEHRGDEDQREEKDYVDLEEEDVNRWIENL